MDLATGAMGSLLPKLVQLLNDEYKLQKSVKEDVRSLEKEMESMHAALRKVAEVPRDQLDGQLKLWAGEVRELSFDMEDLIDKFLVRVDDDSETATKSNKLKRLTEKMAGLFTKGKARHEIADAIKVINKQVQEAANRRERYKIDNIVDMPAAVTTIDPRLGAMYKEVTELVGIAGKRDQELIKLLSDGGNDIKNKLKIVSVVGFGGLGKTTLVKTVYDKIKGDFDCTAFVPVGQNADVKKIFRDILHDLDMYRSYTVFDEKQLIDKLREILKNKRYLIVIDDIWDEEVWKVINMAFSSSNNFGSRLITTTRIVSVSKVCCSSTNDLVYQMEPLSDDDSKRLFYKRIFSHESGCPGEFEEVSTYILKKCGGVPLAIITVASILANDQHGKTVDDWHALLESIGRGLKADPSVEEMMRILYLSYYDLPSHLKTCLLYLSLFPEDYRIRKNQLIWMWIAESFVQAEKGKTSLFEIGENYFNELVNRNMIMPEYDSKGMIVLACRVHDMVLDLISSLSSEDNFATVLNGTEDTMSSKRNIRRLSLQSARNGELQTKTLEVASMFKVRSFVAFGSHIDLMPSFSSYVVLRVLDLTGCGNRGRNHLNLQGLGSMLHLRYLALVEISKVPEEVEKLQFLQVLDLSKNGSVELPSTIIKLKSLMCLHISAGTRLPDGLAKLASLEVLGHIHCDSLSTVKKLGCMEGLKDLSVYINNVRLEHDVRLELEEALVESLGKLSNIQRLKIDGSHERHGEPMDFLADRWMPPSSLREFITTNLVLSSTVPAWITRDPSHLSQLSMLEILVNEVRQDDMDILGKLPVLCLLHLEAEWYDEVLVVGADGFRCLVSFELRDDFPGRIVFQPRAMPKAERVVLHIEPAVGNGGDCSDLGIGHLPSLQMVVVTFADLGHTVEEIKQAEAAVAKTLRVHPNRPTFQLSHRFPGVGRRRA